MPGQAAYLGHHLDECLHVLQDGALELRRQEDKMKPAPAAAQLHLRAKRWAAGVHGGSAETWGKGDGLNVSL